MRWGRGSDQKGKGLRVYFMSSRQNFKPLGEILWTLLGFLSALALNFLIFGPFLAHLGLLWGPRWTRCGFYWPFPMIPGTLSTLMVEAVVFEGPTPQKLAAGGQYLMKMMIFLLDKNFNRVK